MEIDMSKKNKRGNREPRKPKQAKAKPQAADSIAQVMQLTSGVPPDRSGRKRAARAPPNPRREVPATGPNGPSWRPPGGAFLWASACAVVKPGAGLGAPAR